jgi:tetratricopeptide (TPR) repeat protein
MRSSIASGPSRKAAFKTLLAVLAGAGFCAGPGVFAQAAPQPMTAPLLAQATPLIPTDSPQAAPAISDPRAADTALEQARRLADDGRTADALAALELALQASPSDVRLRFLKGVLLTREGRDADAIDVFRALSQEFPELPEPHNNLAALHAARGELDKARAALDEAIRALPSYALGHENLGDVHLRLAMRAWERAARLDPANTAASTKLKLAQELADRLAPGGANPSPALPGTR